MEASPDAVDMTRGTQVWLFGTLYSYDPERFKNPSKSQSTKTNITSTDPPQRLGLAVQRPR